MSSWYDRVYMCVEKKPTWIIEGGLPVSGFECRPFDSLEMAEESRATHSGPKAQRTASLPICSYVPNMLDTAVLGTKLKKRFNLGPGTPCHVRIVEGAALMKST